MSRRQLTYVLGVIALVVMVNLFSDGRWLPDRSSAGKSAEISRSGSTSARNSPNTGTRAGQYTEREPELPSWLPDAPKHPDPRVRIRALETWAQHPGETLDPVTYALVDPDESVRARAQDLLEATLARR
jgi:hypothetical protein